MARDLGALRACYVPGLMNDSEHSGWRGARPDASPWRQSLEGHRDIRMVSFRGSEAGARALAGTVAHPGSLER